ncbi:hypothetical protein ACWGNZ_07190 [Sphingomonas zeae]
MSVLGWHHDQAMAMWAARHAARHAAAIVAARELGPPSEVAIKVEQRLRKWRRFDEGPSGDGIRIFGISQIRQGIGDKIEVRAALFDLHARGRVERHDCTNGTYWRAATLDIIDVRKRAA